MERRAFLKGLLGGVAATAAVRTWPFRVYSFPTEIKASLAGSSFVDDLQYIDLNGQRWVWEDVGTAFKNEAGIWVRDFSTELLLAG